MMFFQQIKRRITRQYRNWRIQRRKRRNRIAIEVKAIRFQGSRVDIAGKIVQKRNKEGRLKEGDFIYGTYPNKGKFFTKSLHLLHIQEENTWHIPENVSMQESAGIVSSGCLVVETVCEKLHVKPQSRVMLLAQNDSFSYMCLELISSIGAKVTVVTSQDNFDMMKRFDVDILLNINYEPNPILFEKYDAVIDGVGGHILEWYYKSLILGGKIVPKERNPELIDTLLSKYEVIHLDHQVCQRRLQILSFLIEEQIVHAPLCQKGVYNDVILNTWGISSIANEDTVYERE